MYDGNEILEKIRDTYAQIDKDFSKRLRLEGVLFRYLTKVLIEDYIDVIKPEVLLDLGKYPTMNAIPKAYRLRVFYFDPNAITGQFQFKITKTDTGKSDIEMEYFFKIDSAGKINEFRLVGFGIRR
jgi:hypothetical protein